MTKPRVAGLLSMLCVLALAPQVVHSRGSSTPSGVQVHLVITAQALSDNSEIPVLHPEKIVMYQGKNPLRIKVDQLIPARGDNAALQLLILIDDTLDPRIGANLNEIRDFINTQPTSTQIGVAYMSNATFQLTQNFTPDHALAAQALRLPRGRSAMDSPYLSLVSLVKNWPQQKVRREVLMVSDGIDRLRGSSPSIYRAKTMPSISPDSDLASTISQRYGVIVHSIYATGAGRFGRNAWETQLGQSGVAKIADETGGEYFSLGTQNAVSFRPFLERLQKNLDNQYYLVFQAAPGKKDGLQRISVSSEMETVDIAVADSVWVSAGS